MKRERGVAIDGSYVGIHLERSSDPGFGPAIQRLRAAKQDMSDVRRNHMCDGPTCNPQSESAFCSAPLTANVFLCRLGSVHLCSQYECPYYSETHSQVCPISRLQLGGGPATSSYDAGDFRTWYAKMDTTATTTPTPTPSPPPPVRHRVITTDDLVARASAMVKLLLFSKCRVWCNSMAYAGYKQESRDSLVTYRKSRLAKRQPMYMSDKYRLQAHFTSQRLPYTIYEFSPGLHDYYVSICTQVWAMALQFYVPSHEKRYDPADGVTEIAPRLDFEQLCLGIMYTMRQGRAVQGVTLLPKDDFLLLNMPLISHLTAFGIGKNQVTKGEKVISQMYENAMAARVDPRILAINVNLLPQKEKEEEEGEGKETKRTKVTSSGEKLFMPTSRKK